VRDAGQIPLFYNHKPSARRGYLFEDAAPLFPFGHGLSYTSFDISAPRLSATRVAADQAVQVEAMVRNTGSRAGDEVVQLYITRTDLPVTRPVLELKGFERVTLAPGESRTVRFTITPAQLAYFDRQMKEVNGPGPVAVHVGNSSASLKSAGFVVA
jgi:beta-glucosidase